MAVAGALIQEHDLAELGSELGALEERDLHLVHADPSSAAMTALLVVDLLDQPNLAPAVSALGRAGVARGDVTKRTRTLARAILQITKRVGGEYLADRPAPPALIEKSQELRDSMVKRLEESLPGSAEARLWLDAIRRGGGVVDLIYDLRALSVLFAQNAEALEKRPAAPPPASVPPPNSATGDDDGWDDGPKVSATETDEYADDDAMELSRTARRNASMLEHAVRKGETPSDRERRALLLQAWTLFVPMYDEVCRVGRFVSSGQGAERSFPPLAMIAAHRRAKRRAGSIIPPRGPVVHESVARLRAVDRRAVERMMPALPRAASRNDDSVATILDDDPGVSLVTNPPAQPGPSEAAAATDRTATHAPKLPPPPIILMPADGPSAEAARGEEPSQEPSPQQRPPRLPDPKLGEGLLDLGPVLEDDEDDDACDDRRAPRRRIEVEVAFCTESNFYLGFTENLSEGGVFVATYTPLPVGAPVDLELHLPVGSIKVKGVVRWLRKATSVGWPGMGVQFERLAEDADAFVRRFLKYREPLFFDE